MRSASSSIWPQVLCVQIIVGLVTVVSAGAQIAIPTEIPVNRPHQEQLQTSSSTPKETGSVDTGSGNVKTQLAVGTRALPNEFPGDRESGAGDDALKKTIPASIKPGTWVGTWEKSNGTAAKFTLCISVNDVNELRAAGTVAGWTCWEVFKGQQEEERAVLRGERVIRNSHPADQYELDRIKLQVSVSGLELTGKWFDANGSSGDINLKFDSSIIADDQEIRTLLRF